MSKTLNLPVKLSEKEHLLLALEMSGVIRDAEDKEAEKKRINARMTEDINELWAKIHELNGPVSTGKEMRDVEVDERVFIDRGEVEIWRLDGAEPQFYMRRPLTQDERQLTNGLEKARAKKKSDKTEEQGADSPQEAEEIREGRLASEKLEAARERVRCLDSKLLLVLPAMGDNPADKYQARVGPVPGFPWSDIVEAFGATEEEARDALIETCAKRIVEAAAASKLARQERILARFGELFGTHTVKTQEDGRVLARIEIGEELFWEGGGADLDEARANLRAVLLLSLEAQEPVVVTNEQVASESAGKERALLKSPKSKGKKDKGGVEVTIRVAEVDYTIVVRAETDGTYTARAKESEATATGDSVDAAVAAISAAIAALRAKQNGADGDGEGLVF